MPGVVAAVTFTEDWFGAPSCAALAGLYGRVADLDGHVVEVGSWEGRSTIALCEAAAPAEVRAVDTWLGSPHEPSAVLAAERDVFATFTANTAHLANLQVFRMGWREYVADHLGPTRLLFVDAEHTYHEVHDTLDAWLAHMVPGGIICGDDAHHPPVQQAVLERFPRANVLATLWWWKL